MQTKTTEYFMKGALERVLQRCTSFVSSNGILVPLQDANRRDYMQHASKMGTMGLRGGVWFSETKFSDKN